MFGKFTAVIVGLAAANLLQPSTEREVHTDGAAPSEIATWYIIVDGEGARAGHASHEVRQSANRQESIESFQIRVQEPEQSARSVSERTVLTMDADGRPLTISEHSQTGRDWTRTEAVIRDGSAEIERRSRLERRILDVPLPAGVRFDNGEGLLRGWNPADHPRLEFDNFSIGAMAVERVVIEPARGATRDGEGRIAVLRKRYDGTQLRTIARLLVDREGRIVSVTQPMFGTSFTIRATDREDALRPHPPYSILRNAMVRSPFRIRDSAAQGHIRYRFSFRDGIAFALPQTGEQRVAESDGGVVVDICQGCGPGPDEDTASLAEALRPTTWLQSDHPRLRAIAAPVARQAIPDAQRMEILARRVQERMPQIDFTGHFSALDALSRGAGDCSEAAALLAALGRAAGIPTRVANGLVYSRARYHGVSNVFMPHSWVIAWVDGEWRSFDAALYTFDSTHIALTIGDGDERSAGAASQLASLLIWEEMTEIRTRTGD
jgi:hypothetical protein